MLILSRWTLDSFQLRSTEVTKQPRRRHGFMKGGVLTEW